MALDYKDVLDFYDTMHQGGETLPQFATRMNQATGTDLYSAGLSDNLLKRGSARLDQLIEKTGLPEYGAGIGRDVGSFVGDEAAGERVGRSLPRMTVNFAPLLIPGAGIPATVARLGGTALLSGAETYEKTGSPMAGLLSGATAAALPSVANTAEQYAVKKLGGRLVEGPLADLEGNVVDKVSRYFPTTTTQKVGGAIGGQVGAAGLFGVSGAAQELLAGETPSNPLTTENLLSLTLGQAPFALAHLGGRALGLGKPTPAAEVQADNLQKLIDLSKVRIDFAKAKKDLEDLPDIAKVPKVDTPADVKYETLRNTRLLLSEVRNNMIKIKNDKNLTEEQKVEQTNIEMNRDYALSKELDIAEGRTTFGDRIDPETPRQELHGRQIWTNKDGTARAIQVSNDPSNPPELVGKIIQYSTLHETPPRFGIESMEGGGSQFEPGAFAIGRKGRPVASYPVGRYNLPSEQWRTVKTLDEWNSKYKKDDNGQPILPERDEPMSQEELTAYLHEFDGVRDKVQAANTTADLQSAVVDLNSLEQQLDQTPTNDAAIRDSVETLTKAGVAPDKAVKAAVSSRVSKAKRKAQAAQQRATDVQTSTDFFAQQTELAKTDPTVQEEMNNLSMLSGRLVQKSSANADALLSGELFRMYKEWVDSGRTGGFAKFADDVWTTARTGKGLIKETPTLDDIAPVAQEDKAVGTLVSEAATVAANSAEGKATFDAWAKAHPDETTLEQDQNMFHEIVNQLGTPKDLSSEELQDFVDYWSDATGTPAQEVKDEVQAFLQRPHVAQWTNELETNLAALRAQHAAPVPNTILNVAGRKGTLLKNSRVNQIVEDFSKGAEVTDAFGGSGQLAQFVKGAGATDVTLNIKDPQMRGVFDEIKHNTEDFANRVAKAVDPIVSSRDISTPTVEGGGSIRDYLDLLEQTDPNVALFIKQNLNARGREVTATTFTPTKIMSSVGLRELPDRIRTFAGEIDKVSGEDGWNIVSNAQAGDKVTVDPPYVGEGGKYSNTSAITVEQRLADYNAKLFPAAERGAQFVVFDIAHPELVKALQDHGFTVEEVQRSSRGQAEVQPELVATNAPEVVRAPEPVPQDEAWTPTTPQDVANVAKSGVAQGGRGMLAYVARSNNPIFAALARDLGKFGDSLDRVTARVANIANLAHTSFKGGARYEVSLSPALLNGPDSALEFGILHELVHGITLSELRNPENTALLGSLDSLRLRAAKSLSPAMKRAYDEAIRSNWYDQYASGKTNYESLMPKGTYEDRNTIYGLLTNDEFVAQGLSEHSFRRFLQGIKTEKNLTGFAYFANLVKQVLKLGEKVSNTAFEEFLSHTGQLLKQSDHVASFRNYSDRYFEQLGMPPEQVQRSTMRAMGLIGNYVPLESAADVLLAVRAGAVGSRTPEWLQANRDLIRMFNENGEDALNTQKLLAEVGHPQGQPGLTDLADSLMLGKVDPDILDMLPERAFKFINETVNYVSNIVNAVDGAVHERNSGVLNIADPAVLRGVVGEAATGIDTIMDQGRMHDDKVKMVQKMFQVTPDGFYNNVVAAPEIVPEFASGQDKKSWFDSVYRFLEPMGQLAKRIPEAAEALARGWQLRANQRKMASEALKAFGMDLTTMTLTDDNIKNFKAALTEPKLVEAVNKWIFENQAAGKRTGETRVIDADDPRIVNLIGKMTPKERDIVEDIVNKHQISMQHMQEQMLEKGLQIASTNGAIIAQRSTGGKLKDAVTLSDTLLRAFTADRSDPNAAALADSQIKSVQARMHPDGFLDLARFTKSAAETWKLQREWFNANPAWSSAQRYGKFLVEFKKNGRTFLFGVDSKKEAEVLAEGRPYKFEKNRQHDEDRPPVLGPDNVGIVNKMRELEQNQRDILQNSGQFTPDQIEEMKRYSPSEQFATLETYRGGVPGLTPPARGLTKGAAELPWLKNHFSWVTKTSNYWSRQLLRAQARAHLLDPEITQNEELRRNLQTHYENILQPDTQFGRLAQRSVMTWFMGFNPASAMINATQPFLTHVAELTAMSGKPLDSYRRVLGALKEIYANKLTGKQWSDKGVENLIHEAYQSGELDISKYDEQAEAQETLHTNYKRLLQGNQPQTTGQRLGTMAGNFSNWGMFMFRTVEEINNMAALISSYKYLRESRPNLSQNELVQEAFNFNHAVNYGGGPSQRPIGAFAGRGAFPRTVAMLATAMQSYNLGTTFQIARYIRAGLFRPAGLTPAEVYNARKALVQMGSTQLALAGVLGLPFASGMLAILNQAFPDLELNRKLREGMNGILGGDEENGHVLTDIAMTGAPSMLGWDLQSRLSMGNTVPGVSEINGFQPEQLLGAPANLVSNFVKGGYKLATGDPHAIDSFMPSALKKFEQLLRSGGQVLDYRDRPIFTPTLGEKVGITLGFQPKRLSDYNAASRIARQADDNIKRREGQFHQQMASEVLKGNFGSVRQAVIQRTRENEKYDPQEAIRAIATAAEELTFPRDLRQEGTLRGGDVRSKLLSTFNIPPTQTSEVDRLRFRQGIQQRLGLVTTSPTGLTTAAVMDQLRQQNPTASRADLRQQATRLLSGRRQQTLALPEE